MIKSIIIYFYVTISILKSFTSVSVNDENFTVLEFSIPWPSGIQVGRLQYSSTGIRPHWQQVHLLEQVLSLQECFDLLSDAISFGTWNHGRHIDYHLRPTSDLSIDQLYGDDNNKHKRKHILSKLQNSLFPAIHDLFRLRYNKHHDLLKISDLFITKYNASVPSERLLGPHKDKTPFSFVMALNSDNQFSGGGTYFFETQQLWKPPVGFALLFHGQLLHGSPIKEGIRYVLAGFIEAGSGDISDFLLNYNPLFDGYAAEQGFRTGDEIIGLEVCEQNEIQIDVDGLQQQQQQKQQQKQQQLFRRRMVTIDSSVSDDQWISFAQSCEKMDTGSNTRILIRRKKEGR